MDDVAVGDTVGWHFNVLDQQSQQIEMTGEVVAIHGDFLAIHTHGILDHMNPFHGRFRGHCHMVAKATQQQSA